MPDNFLNLHNPDFWGIIIRFFINLIFLFIFIRVIYFKYSKKEKYVFSFFLMGIMIFFLVSMVSAVYMSMGMGFTLFAVFAIIRFRTRNFSIKDMAYMFTVIGISLINALKTVGFPLLGVIIFNIMLMISAVVLEESLAKNKSDSHRIIYNNLELLKPDMKQSLLKNVSSITGKNIFKVRIRRIDYKKKVALLDVYYKG